MVKKLNSLYNQYEYWKYRDMVKANVLLVQIRYLQRLIEKYVRRNHSK